MITYFISVVLESSSWIRPWLPGPGTFALLHSSPPCHFHWKVTWLPGCPREGCREIFMPAGWSTVWRCSTEVCLRSRCWRTNRSWSSSTCSGSWFGSGDRTPQGLRLIVFELRANLEQLLVLRIVLEAFGIPWIGRTLKYYEIQYLKYPNVSNPWKHSKHPCCWRRMVSSRLCALDQGEERKWLPKSI